MPIIPARPVVEGAIFPAPRLDRPPRRSIARVMKHVGFKVAMLGMLTFVPAVSAADGWRANEIRAGGQAPRAARQHASQGLPADHPWSGTTRRLMAALADGDAATVAGVFTDQHAVQTFDGRPVTLEAMARLARTAAWTCAVSYEGSPDQMASDLAAAVAAGNADPALRAYLTPATESAKRAADVTAIRWLAHVLAPRADQPTGVVLLYHPAAAGDAAGRAKLTVILTAGECVGTNLYRVRRMAVGQFDVSAGR